MSIEPAVHIDPEGHNVYSGSEDALRLVSVPLNINDSLQTLHQALELKHHTARSLEHSRQLLLCYLAGQQEGEGIGNQPYCLFRHCMSGFRSEGWWFEPGLLCNVLFPQTFLLYIASLHPR